MKRASGRFAESRLDRYTFENYLLQLPSRGTTNIYARCSGDESAANPGTPPNTICGVGRAHGMSELRKRWGGAEGYSAPELSLGLA